MADYREIQPILIFDSSETEFLLLLKNLPLRRALHDATAAVDRLTPGCCHDADTHRCR